MATRTKSNSKEPVVGDLKVTPSPEKVESPVTGKDSKSEPVNLETLAPPVEKIEAPAAADKEVVETDVRKKLARKTDDTNNPFVPTNPAQVEADAKRVAEENGFDLNRGTSVGARLMARSQNRFG
jgi:hypothetical protein